MKENMKFLLAFFSMLWLLCPNSSNAYVIMKDGNYKTHWTNTAGQLQISCGWLIWNNCYTVTEYGVWVDNDQTKIAHPLTVPGSGANASEDYILDNLVVEETEDESGTGFMVTFTNLVYVPE